MGTNVVTPSSVHPARVVVAAATDEPRLKDRAASLSASLALPLVTTEERRLAEADLVLLVDADRLRLCEARMRRPPCIDVDFVGGPTGFRRHSRPSTKEALARAVGRHRREVSVFDATAGLCRDTFLLACLGCRVTAVERSPVLAALVEDGLDRARARLDPDLAAAMDRIAFSCADARDMLAAMPGADASAGDVPEGVVPDVVYIDPMYPPKGKSALPQKEMRLCRKLVGDDPDASELLAIAQSVAHRRVVVKRHPHAPPLVDAPSLVVTGRKVRYDVYLASAFQSQPRA